MRVAILAPGPSLITWDQFDADVLIGVNRAPVIVESRGVRCHWHAFTDHKFLLPSDDPAIKLSPTYPHRIYTSGWVVKRLATIDRQHLVPHDVVLFDQLRTFRPFDGWTTKTANASLVLAAWLGARAINVYGADWTNQPDADGVSLSGDERDEDRWKQEGALWQKSIDWLHERDITVTRKFHGTAQ